jgi:hypothetical protein
MTEAIADELERWLSHMVAVACSARRDPDAWQAIWHAWVPGAPATGSYLGEAAHPAEVREVLIALHAACAARLPPEDPGESEAMRDFRRQRMPDFVRTETDAYITRVTPEPDVRSLFAQAADRSRLQAPAASRGRLQIRSRPQAAAVGPGPSVTVLTCRRCGASREADTVYGNCAFCGTAFFPQHGSAPADG